MKLTIEKSALLPIVAAAQGVTDRKSALPVLSHVLLTATDGKLSLSASNTYLYLSTSIDAVDVEPGAACVDAADLIERVKAMPSGPLGLSLADGVFTIKAGGTKRQFKNHALNAADYPKLPQPDPDGYTATMPAKDLSEAIERTQYAMCQDMSRPHVHALSLRFVDGELVAAATDGHRLARSSTETKAENATLLITAEAVSVLRGLLSRADCDVTINVAGSVVFFTIGAVVFGAKLVDSVFPPVDQVIPKTVKHSAKVSRAALLEAVNAVAVASDQKKLGAITFKLSADALTVTARSADKGEATDEIAAEYSGETAEVNASAGLVASALAALSDDNVMFEFSDELDPIRIRPPADESVVAVLMPMRA